MVVTHHIHHRQDPGPSPSGLPQGGQGVDGLARLADDQGQGPAAHDGVAVPELGGQGHLHRLAQQLFQNVLGRHAHMVGGAAGNHIDLLQAVEIGPIQLHPVQDHLPVLDAGGDGVPHRLGLLQNLLEHKVLISALFSGGDLPVHLMALLFHRAEIGVVHPAVVGGELGDLPVVQVADLPGVADDRRHVGGHEVEPLPKAQDERAVLPGGDQPVGAVGAQNPQGIGPLDAVEHLGDRVQDIAVIVVLQQMGHHFRVGLGDKMHAVGLEKFLDLGVVFDDAVMYHRDAAVLAHVGVGVDVGGFPVGGPAGVAQADAPGHASGCLHLAGQRLDAALGLDDPEALLRVVDGHPGRVISPVFQTAQAVQQNRRRFLFPCKSYDPAHNGSPSLSRAFFNILISLKIVPKLYPLLYHIF